MCIMYDDLVKNNVIIELKELVEKASEKQNELDSYAKFMKEVILNTYGIN